MKRDNLDDAKDCDIMLNFVHQTNTSKTNIAGERQDCCPDRASGTEIRRPDSGSGDQSSGVIDVKIARALGVANRVSDTATVAGAARPWSDWALVNGPAADAFSRRFGVRPACIQGAAYRLAGFLAKLRYLIAGERP